MASYTNEIDSVGGGYGFGGGGIGVLIALAVVFWALFKGDRHDNYGGHAGGYGFSNGCGCGPCVQPTFKDESNWEEEAHLQKKLCEVEKDVWKTDVDVWKTACETQKEIACDGQKTRSLIEQNYIQDLRDQLAEKSMQNLTLKNEMFTEKKFDQMLGAIGMLKNDVDKQFCRTDAELAKISCEIPHRPPVWAECITPNTHHTDCDDRRFPRRGRCNDWDDGCCA